MYKRGHGLRAAPTCLLLLGLSLAPLASEAAGRRQTSRSREGQSTAPQETPFQEEYPKLRIGGLLDVRFARTDDTAASLEGGLGKTRYGGARLDPSRLAAEKASLFRLSQASIVFQAELSSDLGTTAHLNLDAEPDRDRLRARVDLIEATVYYRPSLTSTVYLDLRGGIFYPPVSLEHKGFAWTPSYSITPSAINSWIGEEVRVTGGELGLVYNGLSNSLSVSGAGFGGNDPAGSLLAFRGWALTDRMTGLSDRLALAPVSSIAPGGVFQTQAPWVSPFREIDGRLGYYAAAEWESFNRFLVSVLRYDNRADQTAFDGNQYGWKTDFAHLGVRLQVPGGLELLGQFLDGRSNMGFTPAGDIAVDAAFRAVYGLASFRRGRHRFSVRYDRFEIEDQDVLQPLDNNEEKGSGWTMAYLVRTGEKHRLAFELLGVDSDRPSRSTVGLPRDAREILFQASFQLEF
jgi:hypothetical protein